MESRELALGMTDFPLQSEDAPGSEEFTEILKRAVAGDAAAFEQIMVLHQRRVLVTALRLLGRLEDAQDVAQEVFLRLHRHLNRVHEVRDLSPWLYRVTVNVCNDLYRKQHRERQVNLEQARMVSADPEQDLELAEQRRLISQSLEALSRKERAALVLRDIEGLSTREVARILGSTEGTIRSQICTARVKVRKFVERFRLRRL